MFRCNPQRCPTLFPSLHTCLHSQEAAAPVHLLHAHQHRSQPRQVPQHAAPRDVPLGWAHWPAKQPAEAVQVLHLPGVLNGGGCTIAGGVGARGLRMRRNGALTPPSSMPLVLTSVCVFLPLLSTSLPSLSPFSPTRTFPLVQLMLQRHQESEHEPAAPYRCLFCTLCFADEADRDAHQVTKRVHTPCCCPLHSAIRGLASSRMPHESTGCPEERNRVVGRVMTFLPCTLVSFHKRHSFAHTPLAPCPSPPAPRPKCRRRIAPPV